MNFECPQCHIALAVPPELLGTTVRCQSCQHAFALPTELGEEKESPPAAEKKVEEPVKANPPAISAQLATKVTVEALIRFSLIALIFFLCWQVFRPFLGIMVWGLIMAVALYPVHQKLAKMLGGRQGRASTLMLMIALLLFGVPVAMLGTSAAEFAQNIHSKLEDGSLQVPEARESVAGWPIVGDRLFQSWSSAATDFPGFLQENRELVKTYSRKILDAVLGGLGSTLFLAVAFVVAALLMGFGKSGISAIHRIFVRIAGSKTGPHLQTLCTATIRSVTVGVLGVSLIQAILFGIGFMWADFPAPGLLALIVFLLGIIQIPAFTVGVPSVAYVWLMGDPSTSTTMTIVYTVYFLVSSLADNILKPLLLGRGVAAPMPVILLGALGGMMSSGFIGLFVGAVLLAVGYVIFHGWVTDTLDEPAGDGNEA